MEYLAVIEIPKGSDRRIHMSYDRSGFIDLGPITDQIPINDGFMPAAYGYLPLFINKKEKDEVDVIIFSKNKYKTGDKIGIKIFGMFTREDGDHKILARDNSVVFENFIELPSEERQLLLDYFGYKSKITAVDDKETALKYLLDARQ